MERSTKSSLRNASRRLGLTAVLALTGANLVAAPAPADYFGGSYADSSFHTQVSTEPTDS